MRDKSRERPGPSENQATLPLAQFKYGAELGAPGDEYNKSPCGEESLRLLKDKSQLPTLHGDLLYSSLLGPYRRHSSNMALSLGRLVTSTRLLCPLGSLLFKGSDISVVLAFFSSHASRISAFPPQ